MKRLGTGVPGFDRLLKGGIPENSSTLYLGPPGSGKTSFGLAFIREGLRNGEHCMVISLEGTEEELLKCANSFGWDLSPYLAKQLIVPKVDASRLERTIECLRGELPAMLKRFSIKRALVDPLSIFELMFEERSKARSEVFELTNLIKRMGATAAYTAEANPINPCQTRDGVIEYCTDGLALLGYYQLGASVHYAVRVVKLRGSDHLRDPYEYVFTSRGPKVLNKKIVYSPFRGQKPDG